VKPLPLFEPERLSEASFQQIALWLYQQTGITLTSQKKMLVSGRLLHRVRSLRLASYEDYFKRVQADQAEAQLAINLLTTNETYFFREEAHFALLRSLVVEKALPANLRVWSAACATGEEPYSIALILANLLGLPGSWQVDASDINTDVLAWAMKGIYPLARSSRIPSEMLRQFCLKGHGKDEGFFCIDQPVRNKINFQHWNLLIPKEGAAQYDLIFLRNVLIYFDHGVKRKVLSHLCRQLKTGGFLFIGHAESIHGLHSQLEVVQPGCYRRKVQHGNGLNRPVE